MSQINLDNHQCSRHLKNEVCISLLYNGSRGLNAVRSHNTLNEQVMHVSTGIVVLLVISFISFWFSLIYSISVLVRFPKIELVTGLGIASIVTAFIVPPISWVFAVAAGVAAHRKKL